MNFREETVLTLINKNKLPGTLPRLFIANYNNLILYNFLGFPVLINSGKTADS